MVGMPDASKSLTFLEVSTSTIEKSLVFNKASIDFGDVAVGVRETRQLEITN
jgi:hypothetical protein